MRALLLGLAWVSLTGACQRNAADEPLVSSPIEPYDPLPFVDPMIGTDGLGAQIANVNPGATWPLGLVLAGPNTRTVNGAPAFYHCAGYHYPDTHIGGFAHIHGHGIGVTDYGAVHLMPRARFDAAHLDVRARMAPFSHDDEQATVGRYRVKLGDDATEVDIVATSHGAIHRWTFSPSAGDTPVMWLDLDHTFGNDTTTLARVQWDADAGELSGKQVIAGGYSARFDGQQAHFVITFDVTPAPAGSLEVGTFGASFEPVPGAHTLDDDTGGAWVRFPAGTTAVEARVALSYVDVEGARANHASELASTTFEQAIEQVEQAWRDRLSRVRVRGGSPDDQVIFHTAHYHALMMPHVQTDVDGRYRGIDGEVHVTDFDYMSDLSLWDTFRTLHPFWTLAHPDLQRGAARSLVQMVRDGGSLPRWPMAHGYTSGMVGSPATMLLADTVFAGIDGWDSDVAFEAAYAAATGPTANASRDGIADYLALGYLPSDRVGASASKTLEYAWADHALARWADAQGRPEAAALHAQARSWQNVWDPSQRFFVPRRSDGSFEQVSNPTHWIGAYTEGNAWHYRWGAAHDPLGMVALQHGGDVDAALDALRGYLDGVINEPDDNLPDDLYWHGNEPVLHVPAMPSLLGDPDLAAAFSRHVLRTRYRTGPLGLDGNDDAGTLSSWALLVMIGVYPVAGSGEWSLLPPVFSRVEVDRDQGMLVVEAPGAALGHRFPAGAALDGEPLERAWVTTEELLGTQVLSFDLVESPAGWRSTPLPPR